MTALDQASRQAILAGGAGVLGASLAVGALTSIGSGALFLGPALASWLVAAVTLWKARGFGAGATAFGLATRLTLLRGWLVSVVAGFTFLSPVGAVRWWPAALYAAAALADRADGIVARRLGQVTALGGYLDGAMDALGVLAGPLVAVMWRRLPPWYLLLGAAFYVHQAGIWLRRRLGRPVFVERLRRRPVTRFFAGVQMVLIAAALPPVLSLRVTTALGSVLMIPTVVFFVRDWLILTGRMDRPR